MARQATIKIVKIREWINTCCYREDIARIDRMFRHALNKIGPGMDAPLWEKEKNGLRWTSLRRNGRRQEIRPVQVEDGSVLE